MSCIRRGVAASLPTLRTQFRASSSARPRADDASPSTSDSLPASQGFQPLLSRKDKLSAAVAQRLQHGAEAAPILKSNTYVDSFAMDEDDIEDDFEVDEPPLPSTPASSSPPRPAPRRSIPRSGPSVPKTFRTARPAAFQQTPPLPKTRLTLVNNPRRIWLNAKSCIEVHRGFIIHRLRDYERWLPYASLRQTCRCAKCIDPSTKQRLQTMGEAYTDLRANGWITEVKDDAAISGHDGEDFRIRWSDDHESVLTHEDLFRAGRGRAPAQHHMDTDLQREHWHSATELDELATLRVGFETLFPRGANEACDQDQLYGIVELLHVAGMAIITGVPTDKTDNASCTLRSVAQAIGPIRNSFYGETWDVKSVKNSKNIAYTSLNLGLHMDLLYMTDPPRYQLLHCLRNRVEGGASYFVDSFAAAHAFSLDHPAQAALLRRNPVAYEYDNDGHMITNRHTILPQSLNQMRSAVAWSPPFEAASQGLGVTLVDINVHAAFHEAVTLWETYLDDQRRRYTFTMREGDLVLFDNRRVLHARTAFRDLTEEERLKRGVELVDGEPTRWLKGCYLDGEPVWERLMLSSIEDREKWREEGKARHQARQIAYAAQLQQPATE